ncbi:MAG: lysostaphin resistance A-like protein [Planctomycetota bacterium]
MSLPASSDMHVVLFAQAAPASGPAATSDEPTPGQALGGTLLLLTMGASLWMSWIWSNRRRTTGHYLPIARRGVLRVPLGLTAAGIAFAVLMLLMVLLSSMVGEEATVGAATSKSAEAKTEESETALPAVPSADQKENGQSTADATSVANTNAGTAASLDQPASAPDLARMRSMMWLNIRFEIFLFLMFGFFVWLSRAKGRAVPDQPLLPLQEELACVPFERGSDPDSDNSPRLSWDQRAASDPENESQELGAASDSDLLPECFGTPEILATSMSPASPVAGLADPEAFSLGREVRFAGEVFLAAYLPTTMLRLIAVSLYTLFVGEDPGQHQLLEMIQSGVDSTLLVMIALTAVILAPIVEELQFRVVILGGLAQQGRTSMALGLSSILFGLVHGIPDGIALLPLAFALGYTYLQRRSYLTVIFVHFFFNAFNMLLALLMLM